MCMPWTCSHPGQQLDSNFQLCIKQEKKKTITSLDQKKQEILKNNTGSPIGSRTASNPDECWNRLQEWKLNYYSAQISGPEDDPTFIILMLREPFGGTDWYRTKD